MHFWYDLILSVVITKLCKIVWFLAEQFGDDDDVFHSSTEDNKEDHTEMREFQTTEQTSADNYALNSNIKYVNVHHLGN
jgi:hypothetical protein